MSSVPVLVIHGYFTPRVTNLPVHLALRGHGLRTYDVPIPGLNTQDIALSSAIVGETAERVLRSTGASRVDLVGVSMGGVIAANYLGPQGGHRSVRRAVTLGSPLRGTAIAKAVSGLPIVGTRAARQMAPDSEIVAALDGADFGDADLVSIWAEGDTVVSAESTRIDGARSVRAPYGRFPLGHYQLVVDPRNLAFVAELLKA